MINTSSEFVNNIKNYAIQHNIKIEIIEILSNKSINPDNYDIIYSNLIILDHENKEGIKLINNIFGFSSNDKFIFILENPINIDIIQNIFFMANMNFNEKYKIDNAHEIMFHNSRESLNKSPISEGDTPRSVNSGSTDSIQGGNYIHGGDSIQGGNNEKCNCM
jgi:hypothetical protein